MQAGRLDRTISFERPVPQVEDKFGTDQPVDWARVITCRARKMDARPSRNEGVRLGVVVGRNQTTFYCRWRTDITADMRIVLHGDEDVVYQIVGGPAEVDGRKREIEIVGERYSS